jgi:hypothetical protein
MKTLGYFWSYKESKKTDNNTFSVIFKRGISEEYPKEFENKKDFDCYAVKEGDVCSLYLELKEAKEIFDFEYNDVESDYYKKHWQDNFANIMSWEDWKWCWAMSGVEVEASLSHQIVENYIYDELGMDEKRKAICKEYEVLSEKIYDDELDELKNIK